MAFFSLSDPFTMPLNKDEYILDVTTELLKNGQLFYLIFCRSVWYYPLRLDSHLYIEVVFNQVAPDYLEGLLIQIHGEKLSDDIMQQIARIASLLHRAAELEQMPTKDEIKYLLPKPVLALRAIKPMQWVEMVQNHWNDMSALSPIEAKAQCLDILQKWPLFGSCFFAVKVNILFFLIEQQHLFFLFLSMKISSEFKTIFTLIWTIYWL